MTFAFPPVLREPTPTVESIREQTARDNQGTATLQAAAHERTRRYRAAAHLATQVYPPVIARLMRGELEEWCEYGYRLGVLPVAESVYRQVMADAAEKGLA